MFDDPADKAAKTVARLAETERDRPVQHELSDHLRASRLGKTAGQSWVPVYNPATGEWELGSAAGGVLARRLIGSTQTTEALGLGTDLPFDDVWQSFGSGIDPGSGGPGYWALAPGVYDLSAGVVISPPGAATGVMELYLQIGPGNHKVPRQRVWWAVNDECYLNVAITGVEVGTGTEVWAVAGQTALPSLDAALSIEDSSFLSIVRRA